MTFGDSEIAATVVESLALGEDVALRKNRDKSLCYGIPGDSVDGH